MTPFAASLADEPPAIQAPAPVGDQANWGAPAPAAPPAVEPGWLFARVPIAIGGGSRGIAALIGIELDVWPIRWLGVGLETVRGGSTEIVLGGPVASDNFQAHRLRVSGRLPLRGGGFATVTLAGGIGRHTVYSVRCPSSTPNCEEFPGEGLGPYRYGESDDGLSGALEAGLYVRPQAGHIGVIGRVDVRGPVHTFTLGPVFGVEF